MVHPDGAPGWCINIISVQLNLKTEMSHCERNVAYMRFAHNIDFNINFSHNCALNAKAQIYSLEQQGLIM